MSLFLKQSTAVVVSYGPALDKTDGVTEETGLVSALDHATTGIKLSKNGGALTIRHATVTATTYDAYGMYRVTLDTTDTGTLGTLRMAFNEAATCLPVWQDFMVLPANVYDSLVGGSDALDVSAIQFAGQTITASGGVTIPAATLASTTNITAAAGIAVSSIGANVITAASMAADASAEIADTVWDEVITPHAAVGNSTAEALSATFANTVTIYDSGDYTSLVAALAVPTAAANADAVWDEATSGHLTAGTTGKALSDASAAGTPLDAAGVRAALGMASANLDTQIATLATPTNITAATGIDITKILGTAISTPATAGILDVNVKNILNATANGGPTAGTLDVRLDDISVAGLTALSSAVIGRIATDGVDANSIKADAVTKIQNGLATPTNITAGTITTTTNLTNLPAAAALEATLTAMKGATFATGTDSLEAIRDRGDAAWATATGFSTLDAAGVRAAIGLASANLDTQLTAIDDYLDTEVAAIYNRIGAPVGASISADIAGITATVDAADIRAAIGMASANLDTQLTAIDDYLDTELAAIKAKTDNLPAAPASTTNITAAAGIAVSSIGANVITATSIASNAITSAKIATDAIGAAQIAADAVAEIADGVWDEAGAGHVAAGTTGLALAEASVAGTIYTELGSPVGATFSADIAAVKAETATIQAKTTNLPAAPASTTNITGGVITTVTNLTNAPTNGDLTATMKTSVTTAATAATPTAAAVTGAVGSVTGAVGSVTGNIGGNVGGNVTGTVGSVVGAVGSVTGNVGGNVVGSVASVVGAVGSLTTNNDKTGYALTSAERNAVSDALLDRADAIATGITTRQALEIAIAVLAGKLSGAATATITIRDVADTKNVVVSTVDGNGNRTATTITP